MNVLVVAVVVVVLVQTLPGAHTVVVVVAVAVVVVVTVVLVVEVSHSQEQYLTQSLLQSQPIYLPVRYFNMWWCVQFLDDYDLHGPSESLYQS